MLFSVSLILFLLKTQYVVFLFIFFLICIVIIFYSKFYIRDWLSYYYFILFCFMFVMIILIIRVEGLNFILFWDLLGLSRFFLVIYYRNWDRIRGGLNTLLCNHLGDFFLILFIYFILQNFYTICALVMGYILITSFTKSAQLPFSAWLPIAMSAPTPVSSLVHSRTLVTGGLFLIFIYYFLNNRLFFFTMRLITYFLRGFFAIFEKDIKKIVAIRTLSQISFCIFIVILIYFVCSFRHMITHAIFKRTLFIQVGVIIYYTLGRQESRVIKNIGFIFQLMTLVSVFSLCGLIFLRGVFRKDLFLLAERGIRQGIFFFILFFICVSFTFYYSFQLLSGLLVFSGGLILRLNSITSIFMYLFVLLGGLVINYFLFFSIYLEIYIIFLLLIFFTFINQVVEKRYVFLSIIKNLFKTPVIKRRFIFEILLNNIFLLFLQLISKFKELSGVIIFFMVGFIFLLFL